jgi:hypothetical protein
MKLIDDLGKQRNNVHRMSTCVMCFSAAIQAAPHHAGTSRTFHRKPFLALGCSNPTI